MDIAFADILNPLGVVRSESWIDQRGFAVVFSPAVAGGPRHDELRTVRNRFRGQNCAVADLVAVEHHLAGAVGIHRPEMMIAHVKAVHVFPTHVRNLAAGEHPGRVVVFDIGRQNADLASVGVAFVQRSDLRHPALNVSIGPRGTEYYLAVRQVGGFEIVPSGRE